PQSQRQRQTALPVLLLLTRSMATSRPKRSPAMFLTAGIGASPLVARSHQPMGLGWPLVIPSPAKPAVVELPALRLDGAGQQRLAGRHRGPRREEVDPRRRVIGEQVVAALAVGEFRLDED